DRDLDVADAAVGAVGVPVGVAAVVVPVGAHVVEILAEQGAGDGVDARVVEEGAELGIAVDEGGEAGALAEIVASAVVAATARMPQAVEGPDDAVDAVGDGPRQVQEAEGVETGDLVGG